MENNDIKSFKGSPKKTSSKLNNGGDSDKVCKKTYLSRNLEKSDIFRNKDKKARDLKKKKSKLSAEGKKNTKKLLFFIIEKN